MWTWPDGVEGRMLESTRQFLDLKLRPRRVKVPMGSHIFLAPWCVHGGVAAEYSVRLSTTLHFDPLGGLQPDPNIQHILSVKRPQHSMDGEQPVWAVILTK